MSKYSFSNLSFLIVDDENISRVSILRMLKKMGDPSTHSATNGVEALPILQRYSIDCVIADFNMPAMHGLQLLYKIRTGDIEATQRRFTPVVMLTAHGDSELVHLAMQLDVNAFLLKPATVDSLGAKVQSVLSLGDPLNAEWLKGIDEYEKIDANRPIEDLLKTHSGTKTSKQNFTQPIPRLSSIDAVSVNVNELKIHSTLAKPCTGSNGHIFAKSGTILSQNTVQKLQELAEMGVIQSQVWIRK